MSTETVPVPLLGMELVEEIVTNPCLLVPTLVPLKANTPVSVADPCGVTVVDPMPPVVLVPLVPVNTRLSDPVGALLVTVTMKFVLPPVITALVPPNEVEIGPSCEINCR